MNASDCQLCGNPKASEVRVSLARWRYPEGAMFGAVPRCIDRKACRARCKAAGEDWPVIDPDELSELPGAVR
jgi:hypothetical protein